MDFTLSLSSDWYNLLSIPLILITLKEVIPNWQSIWDDHFTANDRRLIMRIVIFLALPVVVFIHESGHFLAALQVGAKVYDFHYGPVSGYVMVDANIPPENSLWIAVAGNLAQVVVGLISLSFALVARSPALVTFLVYLGLYSIGGTVIFYAALSLASVYGDWEHIYKSPCTNLVVYVGVVHAALVAFVIYCVAGAKPRQWFTEKTLPGWGDSHRRFVEEARKEPSVVNLVALSSSFAEAGMYKDAQHYLQQAENEEPDNPGIAYLHVELALSKGDYDTALKFLEQLAHDEKVSDEKRAQIVLQIGEIWLYRRDSKKGLECFEAAANLDPGLGDSHLQRAILKSGLPGYDELDYDLEILKSPNTRWIYNRNYDRAQYEISKLEKLSARQRQGT